MANLRFSLFGSPRLERDGVPLKFDTRKIIALVAYLALDGPSPGGQPHTREALITLLWPELKPSRARAVLRRNLSLLRKALDGEWLVVDRETISLDPDTDLWMDVDQFRQCLSMCETHGHPPTEACPDCIPLLEEAAALYGDHFLTGFTLRDSLAFDEWQFFQTEELKDQLASALERLASYHSAREEYEPAIVYARRWLGLDPLHEPAHRHLMQLYAQAGRWGAALRQYQECVRILEEELEIPPTGETTALYERIRAERARPAEPEVTAPIQLPAHTPSPAFLTREEEPAEVERSVFVGREYELARLDEGLEMALAGKGQVVFVTGGPGRGKTALIHEFARRAMEAHPDLLVTHGNCNAYSGVGDPYLPFREVLGILTGDVESRWAAGMVTTAHARRLWAASPLAMQTLVEYGSALIGAVLPGVPLLSRAVAAAPDAPPWLARLKGLAGGEEPNYADLAQSGFFEQFAAVLRRIAEVHPLLLVVDDLQWVDGASTSLLFHLGRRMSESRILIVGAYRPEEVALGRGEERHPLERVLSEFKRSFGDVWIDLARADEMGGRQFVEGYLDTEPNRLDESFRSALLRRTGGHPLFTIELLRAMQDRGDVVLDGDGFWVEGPALDWEALPARVEAVVAERIERLEDEFRQILSVASVEGEGFTAQVVARVEEVDERKLLRDLSQELEKRHRLVREQGEVRLGHRTLSRYRFAHALFQQYLYNDLSAGERRLLHRATAEVLEELYEGHTAEIVVQLAHHWERAEVPEKAIEYLLEAGDQARLAYAGEQAADCYQRALSLLKERGEHERAARTLMRLGLTYHTTFDFERAHQAYDEGFALWQRADEIRRDTSLLSTTHTFRISGVDLTDLSIDPAREIWDIERILMGQLFSGLVDLSSDMEIMPNVARSWEALKGGRQYVFHLRDDVRWSDGVPVTAGDFEYAWKRNLSLAGGANYALYLYAVKGGRAFHQRVNPDPDSVGVRALDETTLFVELEEPTAYFLYLLAACMTSFPVPRHVVEACGEEWTEAGNLVTNGPFRLETWQRGKSMTLMRNPDFHGRFSGNLQRVELVDFPPQAALLEYEANNLDVLYLDISSLSSFDWARRRHAGEYISVPLPGTIYINFDKDRSPCDDVRVRRAFALAADRKGFADVAMGILSPATGGFVPPGIPGHSAGISLPYDPERARQLLAEAGYPDGRGFPIVKGFGPPSEGEYLQTQWRENLKVEITWEAVEWEARADIPYWGMVRH